MTESTIDRATIAGSITPSAKRKLKGEDVGIPVRTLGLTYGDELPTLWFGDNGPLTSLFTGFSATLPEAEDQLVYSVRLFQKKITDPILQAQVRAFIGQEAHHSREHEMFNRTMVSRGFALERIENQLRALNQWIRKHLTPAQQLATSVCDEHMTALLANYFLTHPEIQEMMAQPARTTWAWHAIEELEHKSVVFDVYDQLVGDRTLLRRTMVFNTVFFIAYSAVHALLLMPPTGQITRGAKWREAFTVLRDMWRFSKLDYLDFYKPDYHPSQHDCRETLAVARQQYLEMR